MGGEAVKRLTLTSCTEVGVFVLRIATLLSTHGADVKLAP